MKASSGCLQLLEISWNLKTLLEIFWNLTGPPGNFCVRCRRSTALVSSHKNMDKYSLQKYEIYCHQMCFFQVQDAPKPIFGRGSAPDPCGGAYDAPPDSEARQTCPGFFLRSLLESPGNLLEICLIKFVDTLFISVRARGLGGLQLAPILGQTHYFSGKSKIFPAEDNRQK